MANKLPPEIEARLDSIRDEWIGYGLSTQPADREKAEDGVREAYQNAGLEPPETFIWVNSPLAGTLEVAVRQVKAQVWDQDWAHVRAQVSDRVCQVVDQVMDQVRAQVWAQVRDQVEAQDWAHVRAQVSDRVWAQVGAQVWSQVMAQVRSQVGHLISLGQHSAGWLSFYDVFRDLVPDVKKLDGIMKVAKNAGWWWAFEKAAILTERPTRLRRDEGNRLHCADGPALLYPDGFGVWAWHGLRVDRRIIEQPETITVDEIEQQDNAEIRRVMIERYGQVRYLHDAGAEIIQEDEWGTVYRRNLKDDEPLVMVKVVNSTPEPDGTFKDYFLRVQPDLRPMGPDGTLGEAQGISALNAVASTFGLTGKEYLEALAQQS